MTNHRPKGYSSAQVLVIGVVALLAGLLLNARSLSATALRQPAEGAFQEMTIAAMEQVERFSAAVRLTVPRQLLEDVVRGGDDRALSPDPLSPGPAPVPTLPAATVPPTTAPTPSTAPVPLDPDESEPVAPVAIEVSPLVPPSLDDPLKVWMIGDSFMELFGPAFRNRSLDSEVVVTEIDFRFISSIVRPDYYDWPARIRLRMPEVRPDVVVVMFGGNDGQRIIRDGRTIPLGSGEWLEAYATIVGETMDLLLAEGATRIYWVGMPIMRSANFTRTILGMNLAYRVEAMWRPEVTYVSSFELFQDDNGDYSAYLPDPTGRRVLMRHPDGAHLLWPGAYLLAEHLLSIVAEEWGFEDRL